MLRLDETALTLIGRYIVNSIAIAVILMLTTAPVPRWCAFPLAVIWMIERSPDRRRSEPRNPGQPGGVPMFFVKLLGRSF